MVLTLVTGVEPTPLHDMSNFFIEQTFIDLPIKFRLFYE